MAAAPRPNNKATKIAYKILGVPDALKFHQSTVKKSTQKRLQAESIFRK